ncbi:endoglucanase [Leptinotarsa decemlineata]|uniref:Cellulase n=1 Tax=Leptinotarsa decemlineata TaxID=7539 RepID=A0A4D6Q3S7_LEPDE|nr:endoglucanase-like [Leptinotarsa decemlineata]QCF40866.1 glycoside hydrolase family 45 protein [Leptinotarsa decemlineata]
MKTIPTILTTLVVLAVCNGEEHHHIKIIEGGIHGPATTTRYWDCCKPTCSWPGNIEYKKPVKACRADGVTAQDPENQSGCIGGQSYVCTDQSMYAINDTLAYGFVAAGFSESTTLENMCCACVMFTFKDQGLENKKMVVQMTNTGKVGPEEHDMFDIAMPGSGVGYYTEGCTTQWNSDVSNWGDQYGGVRDEAGCYKLPKELLEGCLFRFHWMKGASNPDVYFQQVECPKELTDRTGCFPLN